MSFRPALMLCAQSSFRLSSMRALAIQPNAVSFSGCGGETTQWGELAPKMGITQPAVSQHLRVLRKAKLVTHRSEGTRRHYRASTEGLESLRRYIESLRGDVLAAFAAGGSNPAPNRAKGRRPWR